MEAGPELDGCLDDPAWQLAEPSEDFLMVEPWPGRAMRFPTALRIVYDSENLYLGFSCADENPLAVTARGMERDGGVLLGDHVLFMLDSFGDRRTGYVFAVSPDGGRWDALSRAGDRANANWDGVWEARTSVHSEGWDAEIRIPFRTLGYRRNGEWWGINASRTIQRFGETRRRLRES